MDQIQHTVFSRLDHILRLLLASIEQLQLQLQLHSHQSQTAAGNNQQQVRVLILYKTQCELFQNLREAIDTQGHAQTSNEKNAQSSKQHIQSHISVMHQMQKYILLPIILILQRPPPTFLTNETEQDNNNDNANANGIQTNAHRRCIEEAALSLKLFIDILHQYNKHVYDNDEIPIDTAMGMDVDLRIKCVVAVTESLTGVGVIQSQKNKGRTNTNLDKGEECMEIMLSCMEVLCKNPVVGIETETDDEFVSAIQTSMNGQLLFQMVQCCLSVFGDDSEGTRTSSDDYVKNIQEKKRLDFGPAGIKGNVVLKVQALQTLEAFIYMGGDIKSPTEEQLDTRDMTKLWRAMFPGVFKILFREVLMHLRFSTSQSSPKVATKCLRTLSILLNRTLDLHQELGDGTIKNSSSTVNESTEMLLAAASNDNNNKKVETLPCSPELSSFLQNVHKMIPGPLIMILKLIPTNKSTQTRVAGVVHLCESILIKTKDSWEMCFDNDADSGEMGGMYEIMTGAELKTAALECVIIMSVEENETIANACKEIIRKYRCEVGNVEWSKSIKEYVVPRIVSLLESLPSLAKSGRESELSSVMQLITGYLVLVADGEKNKSFPKNVLSKYISHQLTQKSVRRCLVDLFTMDSSAETSSKLLQYPGENVRGFYNIQYRFMRGMTVDAAHNMLHHMALVFGYKRSILFSDECISILFEALSTRVSHDRSLRDSEHSRWLEKHFGLAVLSKEFLKAFNQKRHKKKLKTLISLTSTMVPIICSDLLWHLPSSNKWDVAKPDDRDKHTSSPSILRDGPLLTSLESLTLLPPPSEMAIDSHDKICTEAINGNGTLLVCLMDLISTLAFNLSTDFNKFIPAVLYPLVQKTSDLNSSSVQDAAFLSLHNISNAAGYGSLDNMLDENYSYLMETLISELNTPQSTETNLRSQAICFYSLHNIIEFMLNKKEPTADDRVIETKLLLLADMQASMTKWFNAQFRRSTRNLLRNVMVPMGLISVFISSATYLHGILSSLETAEVRGVGLDSILFQWEDLLLEFEEGEPTVAENTGLKSTHGIPSTSTLLNESDEESRECRNVKISAHVLGRLSRCLEDVLTINSTLLSLPDLKLQTKACELFSVAFRLLSSIQHHAKNGDPNDPEITSIGNPLLQSVHKYWPSLQIRFQSATTLFMKSLETNSNVARTHVTYLLSSILEVVSSLSGLCGDFIADKFNSGIWPHLSRIFAHLLSELEYTEHRSKHSPSSYSRKESVLFISMLNCMKCIYSSDECSMVLSPSTLNVGTMIFPLLSQHNDIGEAAMDVIKILLQVDCDCLWRALLSASGNTVDPRPLRDRTQKTRFPHEFPILDVLMADRAKVLTKFIHELPEQPLL